MRCLLLLSLVAVPEVALAQQLPPPVEIAVERRLANELHLHIGDTLRVGTSRDAVRTLARIAAIYEPAPDPATVLRNERRVRLHLADLATMLNAPDRVDRIAVSLLPGIGADSASVRLNRTAFGYRAYVSDDIARESSQTFAVVSRFHRAIGVITVVASAVFLLSIMLLKVEERRLDAAVMRFVGVRRRTIFLALLLEAALVAVVGAFVGVLLAYVASAITNLYYQHFFSTALRFSLVTPEIVMFGTGLSIVLGVGAGALAALRLVRTRPMVLWSRG